MSEEGMGMFDEYSGHFTLLPMSEWKLVACVYVIALRRVKSDVAFEDTEYSERKAKRILIWVERLKMHSR